MFAFYKIGEILNTCHECLHILNESIKKLYPLAFRAALLTNLAFKMNLVASGYEFSLNMISPMFAELRAVPLEPLTHEINFKFVEDDQHTEASSTGITGEEQQQQNPQQNEENNNSKSTNKINITM